jgi:ATP-dependent Clp protease ATP-binding subunit ClpB
MLLGLTLEKEKVTPAAFSSAGGVTPQSLNTAIEALRKGRTADSATHENAYDGLKKHSAISRRSRDGKLDPVTGVMRKSAAPFRTAAPRTTGADR